MRALQVIRMRAIVPALLVGLSAVASAQNANASTAATGLSGAFTARATGYNAVAWNPANLAMPGNPGFSFTLAALDGSAGLRPIDLARIKPFGGDTIPHAIREQWMLDVAADSGEKGAIGGGFTELGLSIGHLAFQVNTKVASDINLAPDFVEAILFGNAGRTNTLKNLSLTGSKIQAAAYSTGAVSFGMPLSILPLSNFAVGATVKYTVAHGLIYGLDNGSAVDSTLKVNFPVIQTSPDSANGVAGAGIGLDLGGAWTIPGFRFGVSFQNVFNSFKWDTTKLVYRPVTGTGDVNNPPKISDSATFAYSTAPASLRAKVADLKFKQVIAAGVAFDWLPKTTVSVDARQQVGDGLEVGPKSTLAAGVEARFIPLIPLRAGASAMTGGFGISGGVGIHLLGFELGVAGFLHHRDGGTESGGTLNIFSIRP